VVKPVAPVEVLQTRPLTEDLPTRPVLPTPPILFPSSFEKPVGEYLRALNGRAITAKPVFTQPNALIESDDGPFWLTKYRDDHSYIIFPGTAQFGSAQDFGRFQEAFDCSNPAAGQVVISAPAVAYLNPASRIWTISQKGRLKVLAEHPSVSPPESKPQVTSAPVIGSPANKKVPLIAVATVIGLATIYYFYTRATIEGKLNSAVARGNLLKPPGESAFDYYRKLKEQGMNESLRQRVEEKLIPAVTARPNQMILELTTPGAQAEMTLNDWQEAHTLMNWAAEMRPSDSWIAARANYCAGRVAYLSNKKDDALTFWKRAAEQDKTWAMPLNGIGLIYNERKNYQTARTFLFEAIRREPQLALPYNNIGTSFFYEKNDAQAEGYYRQAIERAPQWPRPHAWLGDIAMRRKDFNMAVQEYQAVLDLDPSGGSGIDINVIRRRLEQAQRGAAATAGVDGFSYTDVNGTIGNIKIQFSFNVRGGNVTGSIRYGNNTERTRLEGVVDESGVYRLSEYAPDGRYVGYLVFKAYPANDGTAIYSGTWMRADEQRQLPFKLELLGD
jgi:tetratricopeptide (TPR) repeat protein